MLEKQVVGRKFLGKVGSMTTPMEKAELKAYLKGKTLFNYGSRLIGSQKFPIKHSVRQKLIFNGQVQ
jgi:hypothetical protein